MITHFPPYCYESPPKQNFPPRNVFPHVKFHYNRHLSDSPIFRATEIFNSKCKFFSRKNMLGKGIYSNFKKWGDLIFLGKFDWEEIQLWNAVFNIPSAHFSSRIKVGRACDRRPEGTKLLEDSSDFWVLTFLFYIRDKTGINHFLKSLYRNKNRNFMLWIMDRKNISLAFLRHSEIEWKHLFVFSFRQSSGVHVFR